MHPADLNSTPRNARPHAWRIPSLLLCLLLGAAPAQGAFDVTIAASGSSSGGAWSGDTWTASASGARVLASEVQTHLASGPTTIRTGSSGSEFGDLYVDGDIAWSANALTLHAAHDVIVDGALVGSGTATLVVEYGQGAVAAGSTAVYRFNTPVKLAPYAGAPTTTHLSTKQGSDGTVFTRGVPPCSGRPGGCPFLKNSPGVTEVEYHTMEYNGAADTTNWIFLRFNDDFPTTYYPYAMDCVAEAGTFRFPRGAEQAAYFDASGAITDLANLIVNTTTSRFCRNFSDGPIFSFLNQDSFPNGYMVRFDPAAGAYGNVYNHFDVLVTALAEANTTYKVYDVLINIRPHTPTATGAADLELTAPSAAGTTDVTLTGSGDLTIRATSSNTTLLPNANITGADGCTAAGSCTLAVTAAAGQYGTATVTVTAEDFWGQRGSDTFTVTVLPPAPTVTGTASVRLGVSNAGNKEVTLTGTGVLTVTTASSDTHLLPNANIAQGAGCDAAGTCTLTLTPAAGQTGRAEVTLTVADSWGRQDVARFTVDVLAPAHVVYNGNGHTAGAPPVDSGSYLAGDDVVVLDGALERTGYTFTGWNTRPDGKGVHYDADERVAIEGDTAFYAEWKPATTTVSLGGGALSWEWLALLPSLVQARRRRSST